MILTSMLKRVDTAVYDAIAQTAEGDVQGGFQVFGLADDGVGTLHVQRGLMTPDIVEIRWMEYKEQIIGGEIVVPEEPGEGVSSGECPPR